MAHNEFSYSNSVPLLDWIGIGNTVCSCVYSSEQILKRRRHPAELQVNIDINPVGEADMICDSILNPKIFDLLRHKTEKRNMFLTFEHLETANV